MAHAHPADDRCADPSGPPFSDLLADPFADPYSDLAGALLAAGVRRGAFVSIAVAVTGDAGSGAAGGGDVGGGDVVAVAQADRCWSVRAEPGDHGAVARIVTLIEDELRPRWVWWTNSTAATLLSAGVRVATCWDVAAVHRLQFGGWRAEPARVWALLHSLSDDALPVMGQLGLLDAPADEGDDADDPVRPDGHLRPEFTSGGWASSPIRLERWAATALRACEIQRALLRRPPARSGATADAPATLPDTQTRRTARSDATAETTARSESAAEILCVELAAEGLPIDLGRAEAIIAASVGPRPRNDGDASAARARRDSLVLAHAFAGHSVDLRNPAHVKAMLANAGIDVPDTRKWRLAPYRDAHPLVDALLTWRKAERIATTYGYSWLDEHVGTDGRLRGAWTGSDGAAGRMTAQAGLHNLPAEMRDAVAAEPGHVFVHADLGQIEPRVLAAVSGDRALAEATASDDLYAPVAQRLGVERPVAKIAVLAAMYGQTSGAAGQALRGMESAYPVAMQFLRNADREGQAGRHVRTYGGRLVRMSSGDSVPAGDTPIADRSAAAARGRYARNAVIQGAAAELFKAWAALVRSRVAPLDGRIVLCLHDELLLHAPTEHGETVARLLESSLPEAAQRWMPGSQVRYVAVASVIDRWSQAKG